MSSHIVYTGTRAQRAAAIIQKIRATEKCEELMVAGWTLREMKGKCREAATFDLAMKEQWAKVYPKHGSRTE